VELQPGHVSLVVECSHHIMVRNGQRPQPMTARSLRKGGHVLVGGNGVEVLVSVKIFSCVADTLAIILEPDDPIELFSPRHGRQCISSSQGSADIAWSMADTDYSSMNRN